MFFTRAFMAWERLHEMEPSLPSVEAALVHVVAHERFEHAVDHVLRLVDVGRAAREAAQAPVRRGHEGRALLDVLREPPPDVARALALGDLARARLDVVVKLALVRVAEALLLSEHRGAALSRE